MPELATSNSMLHLYYNKLIDDVIPFWARYSPDKEKGGYFTCLLRDGTVYDTDKFVWLQARQVWMFSTLYMELEQREDWLEIARLGADFLRRHGRNDEGNWYFSLDRKGVPLVQPYNIFSDCFATMAFEAFARATGDEASRDIATQTYRNILRRRENPKGVYTKIVSGSRPLRSLALPMILANISHEMKTSLPKTQYDNTINACIEDIFNVFLDNERQWVHEHAFADGSFHDSFDGRLIIPGHTIEAMWFMMQIAHERGDRTLIDRAIDIIMATLDFGWDKTYGGIYYFMDSEGKPPQQLEWDQKLWWVHAEALVALAMGWRLTDDVRCREWFECVHDYTWAHFADPSNGEWYGYLNRRGEVLLDLKGGKWKGCFHTPRALYLCFRQFEAMINHTSYTEEF